MKTKKANTFPNYVTDLPSRQVGDGAIYARLGTDSNRLTKTALWDVYLWLAIPFMIQLVGSSINP